MTFLRGREVSPVRVRMWNDWYPYKKAYVIQGFYELDRKREVALELVEYEALEKLGAPSPSEDQYQSLARRAAQRDDIECHL